MKTITYKLKDLEEKKEKKVTLKLGYVGENEHVQIRIDCAEIWKDYPAAVASLAVEPPEGDKYPAIVTRDGDVVCWTVKDSDLVKDGYGRIQLTFTEGSEIQKTVICRTKVDESIVGSGTAPDPIADFVAEASAAVEAAEEAAEKADAAAEHVPYIGSDGFWYTWDGSAFVKGVKAQGEDGEDGHSPELTADKVGKTTTIYADGQQLAQILDGEDGQGADVIDDTAGEGDTDKTWSADKIAETTGQLLNAIDGMKPTAQPSDIGKALILKTIDQTGKPTAFEYGEAGGGSGSESAYEIPELVHGIINNGVFDGSATNRATTKDYIQSNVLEIITSGDYNFIVYAYNSSGEYVGRLTTTLVIKTSGGTAAWVTYFNTKAFAGYKYKISVQDKNHPNDTISINDVKSNIKFSYVQDQTVLIEHATAKSEWVLGNFSNSVITSGATPLRLIHIAPTFCEKVTADEGYKFMIMLMNNNVRVARYDQNDEFSSSGTSAQITEFYCRRALKYFDQIVVLVFREDGTTITDDEYTHIHFWDKNSEVEEKSAEALSVRVGQCENDITQIKAENEVFEKTTNTVRKLLYSRKFPALNTLSDNMQGSFAWVDGFLSDTGSITTSNKNYKTSELISADPGDQYLYKMYNEYSDGNTTIRVFAYDSNGSNPVLLTQQSRTQTGYFTYAFEIPSGCSKFRVCMRITDTEVELYKTKAAQTKTTETIVNEEGQTQSVCVHGDYAFMSMNNIENVSGWGIAKVRLSDGEIVQTSSVSYNHANGMTYNAKTDKIIVCALTNEATSETTYSDDDYSLFVVDASTLEIDSKILLKDIVLAICKRNVGISGVAYNEVLDEYYLLTRYPERYIIVVDSNFKYKRHFYMFDTENEGTRGDICTDGMCIYSPQWRSDISTYQTATGGSILNYIDVFTIDGRYLGTYAMKAYTHIEGMDIVNGNIYTVFIDFGYTPTNMVLLKTNGIYCI